MFQPVDKEWIWQGINLSAGNAVRSCSHAHTRTHTSWEVQCRECCCHSYRVQCHIMRQSRCRVVCLGCVRASHLGFHYITTLTYSNILYSSTDRDKRLRRWMHRVPVEPLAAPNPSLLNLWGDPSFIFAAVDDVLRDNIWQRNTGTSSKKGPGKSVDFVNRAVNFSFWEDQSQIWEQFVLSVPYYEKLSLPVFCNNIRL